jgi:anti-anti-sigma regulatory factor
MVVRLASPVAALGGWLYGYDEAPAGGVEPLSAPELEAAIIDAVAAGCDAFVIDLGDIAAVDEGEIKLLTEFAWSVRVAGGEVAVASPGAGVTDALRHLKLDRAFPLEASVDAAAARLD